MALPEDGEVARGAVRVERIHVDHADGLGQRIQRVGGVVLRAQQALFLGGDGEEHHRALGLAALARRRGQLDQRGGAGGVVDGAVVDRVALGVGLADAEVVPVRAVDHGLVRMLAAVDAADHVVRGDHLGVDRVVGREGLALQRHRLEVAGLRLLLQRFEIEPGVLEQLHREIALDPAFQRRCAPAGSSRTMSNMVLVLEFFTVAQP